MGFLEVLNIKINLLECCVLSVRAIEKGKNTKTLYIKYGTHMG